MSPNAFIDQVANILRLQQSRALPWLIVTMGGGVALSPVFGQLGSVRIWLTATFFCGVAAFFTPGGHRRFWLVVMMVLVGGLAGAVRVAFLDHQLLRHESRTSVLEGSVIANEEPLRGGQRLIIGDISGQYAQLSRVRITWRGKPAAVGVGDKIQVTVRLRPLPSPATELDFDYGRRLWFQGIGATGYAVAAPKLIEQTDTSHSLSSQLAHIRKTVSQRLQLLMPGQTGAVAAALTVGDRTQVSSETKEAFRASGLAHLMAISGLHLALVLGPTMLVVRALLAAVPPVARRYPTKKWAAAAALLISALYVLLAGAPIPTVRAFIMAAVVLIAIMTDRRALSIRTVALAAGILLILTPEALGDVSFQLSFAAVTGLIATYEAFRDREGTGDKRMVRRVCVYGAALVLTSLVATLATAPYVLHHFGRLPVYGVVANLIAMPVMAFWVMPLLLVSVVTSGSGFDAFVAPLLELGLSVVIGTADAVADWPGAEWTTARISMVSMVIATLGLLLTCLWRGMAGRAVGAILYVAAIIYGITAPTPILLVAADGRDWVIKTNTETFVSDSKRLNRFQSERWSALIGDAIKPAAEHCDQLGCVVVSPIGPIAMSLKADAVLEDCQRARIVVILDRFRGNCRGPDLVITQKELDQRGGLIIWPSEERGPLIVSKPKTCRPWHPEC